MTYPLSGFRETVETMAAAAIDAAHVRDSLRNAELYNAWRAREDARLGIAPPAPVACTCSCEPCQCGYDFDDAD